MSAWALFLTACVCTGVLALTCAITIWAVKNILEWLDDIYDAVDTLKYTYNKRKKEREEKNENSYSKS